jgi:hypothetical protein
MARVKCPRCGAPGSLKVFKVADRLYLRVDHGSSKKRTYCYLGPADEYIHADWLLALGLTNLNDVDFLEIALNALERLKAGIERLRFEQGGKREALEKLKIAENKLTEYIEEIENLRKELEEELKEEEELEEEVGEA